MHSNWSDTLPVNINAEHHKIYNLNNGPFSTLRASPNLIPTTAPAPPPSSTSMHKTVRNIVLVPYKSKPNEWGSWWVKSPQATYTNPISENEGSLPSNNENEQEEGEVYDPQTPDYLPRHPPEFYEDE